MRDPGPPGSEKDTPVPDEARDRDGGSGASGSSRDLLATLVRFSRALRSAGIGVSSTENRDALRALEAVGPDDREDVYLALRTVLTTGPEDREAFDRLFEELWSELAGVPLATKPGPETPGRRAQAPPDPTPREGPGRPPPPSLESWLRPDPHRESEPMALPTVGVRSARGTRDFSRYGDDELDAIRRAAARLARRMARRRSRRWSATRSGPGVDLRRTMRRALLTGGDPITLARRERKRKKTRLVLLCDVSGSMDLYSRFLVQFLYALQHVFARVETFVFSTGLHRVTEELSAHSFADAVAGIARNVDGWSGGTRIGESLASFDEGWGHLVDSRTVVIVLSDGWDTGEPEVLARALERVRRRAGRVVWLNPLLGSASYEPLTRGMKAALPHVDVFAPAHDLDSLEALERHLQM